MRKLVACACVAATWVLAGEAFAQAPPAESAPPAVAPQPPAASPAPVEPRPPEWKFAFHGFVGVSLYVQDTPAFVLNGQGPMLPLSKPGGGATTGADVRQSRFNLSATGPEVLGGAVPKGVFEMDLFGLNGPGGYGEVSVYPRLRLAYAQLDWGHDVLRLGQDHELILAMMPESMAHIAYPMTYFNGLIGWREPGVTYLHTFDLEGAHLELAAQLIKSDWANPTDFGESNLNDLDVDMGQLSGFLGGEARVKFTSDHLTAFAAGHYNHVEGTHAGDLVAPPTTIPTRNWDVVAGVAGFKLAGGGLSLLGSAYAGKNLGPLVGALLQFPTTNDIREWGAWGQLAYSITEGLSVSAIAGTSQPNASDIAQAGGGRSSNSLVGGMIRYQAGGFAFGPEYAHVIGKQIDKNGNGVAAGAGAPDGVVEVNQVTLSGMYTF